MAFDRKKTEFIRKASNFKKSGSFTREPLPPDPLQEIEYSGDPEPDSLRETEIMLSALKNKERQKEIRDSIRITTDSEYWCAVCFETRAQKDAFLKAVNMYAEGDKYIDGLALAEQMGVLLPESEIKYRPSARTVKRLVNLTED